MDDFAGGCLAIVLAIAVVGAAVYFGLLAIAYFGMTLIIGVDFAARSFSWVGVTTPSIGWLLLGCTIGALIGLYRGLKRVGHTPGVLVHTGTVLVACLIGTGAFFAGPGRIADNTSASTPNRNAPTQSPCSPSNVYSILSKYNWKGTVRSSAAELQIYSRTGRWLGRITYGGVREELSVEVSSDCSITLRGTGYKRLTGRGIFVLDVFTGRLSGDSKSISGTFVDANGSRGEWSVTGR